MLKAYNYHHNHIQIYYDAITDITYRHTNDPGGLLGYMPKTVSQEQTGVVTLSNVNAAYNGTTDCLHNTSKINSIAEGWQERGDALLQKGILASTLNNLGKTYFELKDMKQALSFYNDALVLWRTVGDRHGEATLSQ